MTTISLEPPSSPNLPNKFGNFDLIRTEKCELADIILSKYRSRETGLTLVHLDYQGAWRSIHWIISIQPVSNLSTLGEGFLCCGDRRYALILRRQVISN